MYGVTEKVLARFDKNVAATLKVLLQSECLPGLISVGNDIKIVIDQNGAFKRTLTLKNASNAPSDKCGYICVGLSIGYKEAENRFCFIGELENIIDDATEMFALTFESAEIEVDVYNACKRQLFWDNPWTHLMIICTELNTKYEIPNNYCNSKEAKLLPIIREISNLDNLLESFEEGPCSFSELKKLAIKYGYYKIEQILADLEKPCHNDNKRFKLRSKLINTLCEQKHEPLWRDIYGKIADSQEEYPTGVEFFYAKDELAKIRSDIQQLMEANGYIGEYPYFVKDAVMRGVHLVHSYNMSYWVGLGEKAQYHIFCAESLEENDHLTIQFLCGTALLKKDDAEQDPDIHSCLFNAKGRRLFSAVHHYVPLHGEKAKDLNMSVTLAIKRAECIKLNKSERKEFYGHIIPGFELFLSVFLIAGALFALAMTLSIAIVCAVVTAMFGLFDSIPEMLLSIPWWIILILGWLGFGIPMGIVEVLSRRR